MKTREELAQIFGVHPTTVRSWERRLGIAKFRSDDWKSFQRIVMYEDEVIDFIRQKMQEKRGV